MKKRITAIITALMMLPTVALASLEATLDKEADKINIFGETDKNNVSVMLLNPGYDISSTDENDEILASAVLFYRPLDVEYGVYEYSIKMPSTAERGRYTLYVDSEEKVLYYASAAERLSMIAEVKAAIEAGTLVEYLAENGVYLCDAEKFLLAENTAGIATVAEDFLSETELVAESPESLGDINDALNFSVTVQLLNERKLEEIDEIKNIVDEEEMAIKFSQKELIPESKQNDIIERISSKSISTKDGFYKELQESIFIGVINETKTLSSAERRDFFDEYALDANLEISDYASLGDTERSTVIAQLSAAKKNSIATMQEKLDELCGSDDSSDENGSNDDYTGNETGGGGVSAGGMGGGGGSSKPENPVEPETPVEPEKPVDDKITFSDMQNYAWAEDAVGNLSKREIINGYADGTFKPEGTITRGEFITMISRAFLPEFSGEGKEFADVKADEWYYSYIMAALENKIVNGVSETEFLPNEKIRRCDMAVILNNLLNFKGKTLESGEVSFVDAESIAEYAKNAVNILNNNGIIKGDDKNNFRPNDFANRAEAAVMLDRFINLVEGEGTK